jgi:hypothetical protein
VNRTKCHILFALFFLLVLCRCANPVSPEGGPKDVKPPRVASSDPPLGTTHFNKKDIRITFNEYVQLKDQSAQVTIAPPKLPKTDIRLRGKSILIKLTDSLLPGTTYSINFGNAISDLTENNVLSDFTYSFSTGSFIDSLSLTGRVLSAFDLVPQKDITAMLFVNENDTLPLDSMPMHVKPYYLAKTNQNGEFTLRNLRNVPFLLFAMKDMDGDLIFNLPNEKVGFCDSLVKGNYIKPPLPDSLKPDSITRKDSLAMRKDSAVTAKPGNNSYTLLLFEESDSIQKILKAEMVAEDQLGIYYRFPAKKPGFLPLNLPDSAKWMIPEYNPTGDTVFLWLKNVKKDTLVLRLSDNGKTIDTARIDVNKKNPKKKKADKGTAAVTRIRLTSNVPSNRLNQFKTDPTVVFSYPLVKADFSRILIVDGKDTLHPKSSFKDSLKRELRVSHAWKEDHSYSLIFPDSVFFSYNNHSNDSLIFSFKTYSSRDFGSILMDIGISNPQGDYIIQLLNEKEVVLYQKILSVSGKVKFDFLLPGKFKIKAIYDRNRNGKWDTGKFSIRLQPEKVLYFEKTIEVRSNWDIEESWKL